MVDLKSASFLVIMLLHEGSTHIHSQKSWWLVSPVFWHGWAKDSAAGERGNWAEHVASWFLTDAGRQGVSDVLCGELVKLDTEL